MTNTFRAALLATCISLPIAAQAGVYADDMSRCLVKSASAKDQIDLVRWIFANAALHPAIADVANADKARKELIDKAAAAMIERLMTADCQKETKDAIRFEGEVALMQGFRVLGEVAMRELMSHPTVSQGLGAYTQHLDQAKFEALSPGLAKPPAGSK